MITTASLKCELHYAVSPGTRGGRVPVVIPIRSTFMSFPGLGFVIRAPPVIKEIVVYVAISSVVLPFPQ